MVLRAEQAIALEFTCLFLAFLFLSVRIYARAWLQNNFASADVFLIAAWCFFAANNAADTVDMVVGMMNPNIVVSATIMPDFHHWVKDGAKLVVGLKAMFLSAIFYFSCMFFVKFSFLSLYYTLIPGSFNRLRFALNVTSFITLSGYAMMLSVNIFWCHPLSLNFQPDKDRACYAVLEVTPYATTLGFHVVSDILIYMLPFFLLPVLKKRTGDRGLLGLVAIFSLGFLSIACTIIRAVCVGMEATMPTTGVLAAVEQLVAILVACSPSLKWLWKSFRLVRLDTAGSWVNRKRRRVDEEGYEGDDEGDKVGYDAEGQGGKSSDDGMTGTTAGTGSGTSAGRAGNDSRRSCGSGIVVIGRLPLAFDKEGKIHA